MTKCRGIARNEGQVFCQQGVSVTRQLVGIPIHSGSVKPKLSPGN